MNKKEIVWIFGKSASGKETFIKKVVVDQKLAKKFNWICEGITYSSHSLNFTGNDEDKRVISARKNIIKDVLTLQKDFNVILIKWQYIDTLLDTPQKLLLLLPGSNHKIILLEVPSAKLEARLKNKKWWQESSDSNEFDKHETKMVLESVSKLKSDFEIIKIDSGSDKYKTIT